MRSKLLPFFILLLTTCFGTSVRAQMPQSENMTLLGQWADKGLPRYNDVWGYAANGREYALIGSFYFVHILDVTDPTNIRELHRINLFNNSGSLWRDIKVYDNYAYCVTEANEGLQVIDLSNLAASPSSAPVVFDSRSDFLRCHNLEIDYESTPVKLYALGTQTQKNGYFVYSLADPARPELLASVDLSANGRYIHDAHAVGDLLYANSEGRGMYVYDVSRPAAPVELGVLSNYTEAGYNHSSWRTPDGRYVVMCDETVNTGVKIVDVKDPLDMEVKSVFRSTISSPTSDSSIAHNPLVISNDRVVLSYYDDGIQVWEFSDPENPTRLGYYDTTPNTTTYTNGIWGAYPFLPSGNILGSDIFNGLFVVRLDQVLPVTYSHWAAKEDGKNALLEWSVASEVDNVGWVVEHAVTRGQFEELGFVPAGLADQTFFHDNPGPGIHYYRLRQRDFDGTEHLSEVRTVTFAGGERRAMTYPNPVAPGTPLTFKGLTNQTRWSLWSAAGRQVSEGRGRHAEFDVPAGTYLLKVGNSIVDKIVVQE